MECSRWCSEQRERNHRIASTRYAPRMGCRKLRRDFQRPLRGALPWADRIRWFSLLRRSTTGYIPLSLRDTMPL